MSLPEKLIDKRVLRRTLDKGAVSQADFERYLAELPDRADNVQKPDTGEAEVVPQAPPFGGAHSF